MAVSEPWPLTITLAGITREFIMHEDDWGDASGLWGMISSAPVLPHGRGTRIKFSLPPDQALLLAQYLDSIASAREGMTSRELHGDRSHTAIRTDAEKIFTALPRKLRDQR